jgi:SAM-dependent methyltransferase
MAIVNPDPGFRGETADFYARYRRGYPPLVVDTLVAALGLTERDLVLDLGCGTGQLTAPLATCVRAVIGMDPEPDMLRHARTAATTHNVTFVVGTDGDIPGLHATLGDAALAAVTMGSALHWMDRDRLFANLRPLLRTGGGIVIIANGVPHWRHDLDWSKALRGAMEDWFQITVTAACGTDREAQERYTRSLLDAGYATDVVTVDYTETLTVEALVGSLYSAMNADRLPPQDRREAFVEHIRKAVGGGPITEPVRVMALIGARR